LSIDRQCQSRAHPEIGAALGVREFIQILYREYLGNI
jgi:hypothetical protein